MFDDLTDLELKCLQTLLSMETYTCPHADMAMAFHGLVNKGYIQTLTPLPTGQFSVQWGFKGLAYKDKYLSIQSLINSV